VFFFLWIGYKLAMKTKVIPVSKIDLVTGLREIDEEEKRYLDEEAARGPRTRWQRIWDSL
jgi:amino acid transporter